MPMPRRTASILSGLVLVAALGAACADTAGEAAPEPDREPEPTGGPTDAVQVRLEPVVDGLDVPNDLADLGDGRLLISDQVGRIHVLADGALAPQPVLDLGDRVYPPATEGGTELELGLSGFAPHPEFAENGRIYVLYTEPPPDDAERQVARVDVLAEFTLAGDPLVADAGSERVLLRLEQPSTLHVGGHMAFGPDGLLHVGLGDAGREAHAQDPSTLPGSIIRIDVDGGDPYGVPSDNPYADGGGAPEVYAHGLRNPMRVNWADGVGLLIAEPMWTMKHQEVHVAVAGANYGWPDVVGELPEQSCYASLQETRPLPECVSDGQGGSWEPPVVEYDAQVGRIVSGVVRYQGQAVPALADSVLVADWHGSMLAAEVRQPGEQWPTRPLEVLMPDERPFTGFLWALDTDAAGEVYALTASRGFHSGRGVVYRLTGTG